MYPPPSYPRAGSIELRRGNALRQSGSAGLLLTVGTIPPDLHKRKMVVKTLNLL